MALEVEVEQVRSPCGSGITPRDLRGLGLEAELEVLGVVLPRRIWPIGLNPHWTSCVELTSRSLLDT